MSFFTDLSSATAIPMRPGGAAGALLESWDPEEPVRFQWRVDVSEPVQNPTETRVFVDPLLARVTPGQDYVTLTYLAPLLHSSFGTQLRLEVYRPAYFYWTRAKENVTAPSVGVPTVEEQVLSRLGVVQAEELEDGMTGSLGSEVSVLVSRYGESAILAMASLISSGKIGPEVVSHTLRWIGRMNHPESFRRRLWLLKSCLLSPSAVVRDGAALGLAALGSRSAIPALRAAIQREPFRGLRRDMEQVLELLERAA